VFQVPIVALFGPECLSAPLRNFGSSLEVACELIELGITKRDGQVAEVRPRSTTTLEALRCRPLDTLQV
jgi:hypothetical protein